MDSIIETLIARFNNEPEMSRRFIGWAGEAAVNLLVALLILVVTIWLSGFLSRLVKNSFARIRDRAHIDTTLSNFISSLVRYGVLIVGMVAVFGQLGVQTTSILAVLGAASLAIGLALQGALSNVAAGVMLLFLRPYRIGDLVELNGRMGQVRSLDLFVTEMTAPDGLRLTMPNSRVLQEMIINYTASGHRRIELNFGIGYSDDADKALSILLEIAHDDPRVHKDPAPWAKVTELASSSVTVTLRVWTSTGDVLETRPDLIRRVKQTFDREGLSFPYPHQVEIQVQETSVANEKAPEPLKAPAREKKASPPKTAST